MASLRLRVPETSLSAARGGHGASDSNFYSGKPNRWLPPWRRRTTITPTQLRLAPAESRSFERCAPTTPWHDRTRASTTHPSVHASPAQPASAHAATSAVARCWEGNLVGGWRAGASSFTPLMRSRTKGGSSSASVAHTYTPLGRSRGALVLRLDHDQGRVGDRLLSRGLLHGVCGLHELYRVPLRCTPPSNPNSTLLISCVLLRAPPIPPAPR